MKYVTVSPTLEKAVRDKMEATLEICRKHYNQSIPTPPLVFRHLGRTAGVYHYRLGCLPKPIESEVRINPDFFKNYYDDMMNDTVPHEVAHYVSVWVFGKQGEGHGWRWREVMGVIGIRCADRCHQYDLEGVKLRKGKEQNFKYECGCMEHNMTKTKHARHQAAVALGGKGYRCRRCKRNLVYRGFNLNGKFIPSGQPATPEPFKTKEVRVEQIIPRNLWPKITPTPRPEPKPVVQPTHRTVTKFIDGVLTNVRIPLTQAA